MKLEEPGDDNRNLSHIQTPPWEPVIRAKGRSVWHTPLTSSHSNLAMKSHLRWDCFAWFTMQTISVPPAFIASCNSFFKVQTQGIVVNLLNWRDIFSVCLGVLEAGLSFFLSSLRAHERDCTRVCTYMCANMRASIKDGASWQDVTHLATQKNIPATVISQNKPRSHLEFLAFLSARLGHWSRCKTRCWVQT